jgi:hypothetical protein
MSFMHSFARLVFVTTSLVSTLLWLLVCPISTFAQSSGANEQALALIENAADLGRLIYS